MYPILPNASGSSTVVARAVSQSKSLKTTVLVYRLLKKYKYPPDMQQKATDTVLNQAKLLCKDWAESQCCVQPIIETITP